MKTTSKVQARAKEMFGFITEARHGGYFRETIGNHLGGSRNLTFDPPLDGHRLFHWNIPLWRALIKTQEKLATMIRTDPILFDALFAMQRKRDFIDTIMLKKPHPDSKVSGELMNSGQPNQGPWTLNSSCACSNLIQLCCSNCSWIDILLNRWYRCR